MRPHCRNAPAALHSELHQRMYGMGASNRPSPDGSGRTQHYVQAMAACNAGAVAVVIANTEESFCVMTADADVPIPVVQVTHRPRRIARFPSRVA